MTGNNNSYNHSNGSSIHHPHHHRMTMVSQSSLSNPSCSIYRQSPIAGPSSVLANESENIPAPQCCCFSARFVNLVLFMFNFIFLLSGICILLLTVFYGHPEISRYLGETTKYLNSIISLLGSGHLVQIIHYSMLVSGIVIIVVSLLNIIFYTATSWSRDADYYYIDRRRKRTMHENTETLLLFNSSTLDSSRSNVQQQRFEPFHTTMNDSIDTQGSDELIKNLRPISNQQYYSRSSTVNNSQINQKDARTNARNHRQLRASSSNSTCVLCYIFILLFLFTMQLVIGLLSVLTVSPEHVFISSQSISNDDFLISVRESVNIPRLLIDRSAEIEALYSTFHCCGWLYFDDYEFLQNSNQRNKSAEVPDACCKTLVKDCGHQKHPNNIYYDGCWSKFGNEMRDYVLMLGWTALAFSIVELIGLIFALCHYVQMVSKS